MASTEDHPAMKPHQATQPHHDTQPHQDTQPRQDAASADRPSSDPLRPDTVYRLRGVPERFQQRDIPGLLRKALGEDDEFPVKVGSLAQSPYRVGEKVATVTLPEASRVLPSMNASGGNKLEWLLDSDPHEEGITGLYLDIHFYGFTPLHDGEDAECTKDIIAISGLNGHAFGSFKQRGGPWMWLRDGLPKDLPNTRIFTYGYDTQLQTSLSLQSLTDIGVSLRTALNDLFQTTDANLRSRSLLFIGHSLGGLVIKEAFVQMKDSVDAKIIDATCGFLFFGVPNLGMAIESLVPMVGDQPNRSFLETLGRNSALLRDHQEQFSAIFESKPVQILGFYETRLSRTACNMSGVWKMRGPEALLVDFGSATVGSHNYHPIDRDHSDMVKFNNADDSNYRAVLHYMRLLNGGSTTPMQGNPAPLSEDDMACLSSLAFPDQDWHKDGVVTADGTCNWIFSHDTFKHWAADPRQLLWIRGNPGTGKSTMMKHIFQSLDERRPEGQTLATFFFNGRGKESLTTLLSLYRALLNQILHQSPEHLSELVSKYKNYNDTRDNSWEWSMDELRCYFAKVVPAISAKRHICILVDALDESGEDNARELIEQFEETLAAVNESGGVLKICFSCRYYPILTLENGLTITMETENQEDIETFVKKRLRPFQGDASVVEKAILQKAQGVFQWAKLVANQALDLQLKGNKVERVLLRIQKIPKQLKDLYKDLLLEWDQDEGQENQKKALELFQWMFFAAEIITLAQIRCILDIDEQMKDLSMEKYMEGVQSMEDEDRVRRAVRTLSRGLVEFPLQEYWAYGEDVYALQPIHQTVREYLMETGLRELQDSIVGGPLLCPHYRIFKTSVKFLFLEGVLQKWLFNDEVIGPFLRYSITYLGYHFLRTDQKAVDPEELLDLFQWPSKSQMPTKWMQYFLENIKYYDGFESFPSLINDDPEWRFNWPGSTGTTLLHLAAFVGNVGILESIIRRDNGYYLHSEDKMEWTPLSIAVGRGHEDFAVRILSQKQDFEVKAIDLYDFGEDETTTITHEAAREGLSRTLEKLLDVGVDVDGPEDFRPTPLFVAAGERQLDACKILLDHQANPEISTKEFSQLFGFDWGTPLTVAIKNRDKELSRLLVSNHDEEPSRSLAPTRADVYNALWPTISYQEEEESEDEDKYAYSVFQRISRKEHAKFIGEVLGPISTPLHDACARGNIRVASFLIDKARFDINREDDERTTPLFQAVQEEQHNMISWLFQNYQVRYLSENAWSQLPEITAIRDTYREAVEKSWCGTLGLSLSQPQEDPSVEKFRQWALKAIEDSRYYLESEVDYESCSEQDSSSSSPTANDQERSAKRRRISDDSD